MQHYQVVIIGSGFGGQCAAINLQKRGISDFVILERRAFMGGTWVQNTYPGAAVDVQSPLYSLSFEPYDWSQLYAEQEEIRTYVEHVIDKHALRDKTRLNQSVTAMHWHDEETRWHIQIDNETQYTSQFVINASGPLSTPVIPPFEGRERFKGPAFHTNHWDHSVDYRGKRVAIIGSGASAAQVIPAIADKVEHLYVFQRTPHWVLPRPDYVFKPWQRALLCNRFLHKLLRWSIYWALEFRMFGFKYSRKILGILGDKPARKHIEEQIADPELRRQVTPDYVIGCKRIIVSNTYYPALCRDNVTLMDKSRGVGQINEDGIVTQDGEQIDVDIIVYSTGYDATDGVISYPVVGHNGQSLKEVWEEYPRAYLGTTVAGFPNFFVVTGPNTGIGHTSALFVIESQMRYILRSISEVLKRKRKTIEVDADAEQVYTRQVHEEMRKTVWHDGGCNSWYKSKSGHVIAIFPGFSFSFRWLASRFRRQHHHIN